MTRLLLSALLALAAAHARAAGPVNLIDPELSQWTAVAKPPGDATKTWTVEGGVLKCGGKPTGYLLTKSDYADYTLTLEYRYAPGEAKRPNSGLLVHCQPGDLFWPHSYEVQLARGQIGDVWLQPDAEKRMPKIALPAESWDAKNPKRHAMRLGGVAEKPYPEWNSVEVAAVGDGLVVRVNGGAAIRATGLGLVKGRIGLQSEGAAVEFRKLELVAPGPK